MTNPTPDPEIDLDSTDMDAEARPDPDISVVIPVFEEEETIPKLYERLTATLEKIDRSYEIIFVDDGSRDKTPQLLADLQQRDPHIRLLKLIRNFGQYAAMSAAFERVRGNIVVTLDADLQNPPEEIPKLLEVLDQKPDVDVAAGRRMNRQDPIQRTLPSKISNWLISQLTGVTLSDYGCMLRAYRSPVIYAVTTCQEKSLYLTALVSWLGVSIEQVDVAHEARYAGKSKYSFMKLLSMNFDLVTSYTFFPIQMVSLVGLHLIGLSLLAAVGLVALWVVGFGPTAMAGLAPLMLAVGGLQILALGMVGEYVGRTYREAQNRPYFLVQSDSGPGA